jgi:long-chain acyl-CoA synthetase
MTASSSAVLQAIRQRDRAFLASQNPYEHLQALHEIWPIAAQRFSDIVAIRDPHGQPSIHPDLWGVN